MNCRKYIQTKIKESYLVNLRGFDITTQLQQFAGDVSAI